MVDNDLELQCKKIKECKEKLRKIKKCFSERGC